MATLHVLPCFVLQQGRHYLMMAAFVAFITETLPQPRFLTTSRALALKV